MTSGKSKIIECILQHGDAVYIGESFCGVSALETEDICSAKLESVDVEIINIKDNFLLLQVLSDTVLALAEGKSSKYRGHLYVDRVLLVQKLGESDPQNGRVGLTIMQELLKDSIYDEDSDPLYNDAQAYANTLNTVTASLLQRKFRIGYNRASKLIDRLEKNGIISVADGANPRRVLKQHNNQ